jgi:hypothetical protein
MINDGRRQHCSCSFMVPIGNSTTKLQSQMADWIWQG